MSRPLPVTDIGASALAEFSAPEMDQPQIELNFAQTGIFELHASLRTIKSNQKVQRAVAFIIAP